MKPRAGVLRKVASSVFLAALLCVCTGGAVLAIPITGRVLAPDGKPVADAEVVVMEMMGAKETVTKTDAMGQFTVDVEPSKSARDYLGQAVAIAPGFAVGGIVLSRQGSRDIQLQAATTVGGVVQDAAGQPVANALVRVRFLQWTAAGTGARPQFAMVPESLRSKFTAKTGADGRWTIAAIPTTATVGLLLDDPLYVKVSTQAELGSTATTRLFARPGAIVVGKAVYEDGKPAAGIELITQHLNRDNSDGWAQTTTGDDGSFRLEGLSAGKHNILITDPTEKWVAAATPVQTTEGITSQAADIVLTAGAIVEGTVTDEATGAPLAGAIIGSYGPHRPRDGGGISSTTTDDKGHYRLRVPPGKSQFYVAGQPLGYLSNIGIPPNYLELELAKGETKTADFRLRKGLTVAGRVLDDALRPVAGVSLTLTKQPTDEDRWVSPVEAKADENGKWTLDGLVPGTWSVTVNGGWQVAEPQALQLPAAGEVRVRLRPLILATVKGRVVDTNGQPISGATIKPRVTLPPAPGQEAIMPDGAATRFLPTLSTDKDGLFQIPDIRPGTSVALLVNKDGYIFVAGGKVTELAGAYTSTDVVLAPLTARLEGTILDAAKAPAAGVQVFCPEAGANALTRTDAAGKFVLPGLPAGDVTIIVVRGNDVATTRAKTGETVSLSLKPRPVVPGRDIGRAQEILTRAKLEVMGQENVNVNQHAARMLAAYSPEIALQLGTDFYGNLDDSVVAAVIQRLAEADPVRAAMWAPDKLESIKDDRQRLHAILALGSAVAESDPDLGIVLYQQARQHLAERPAMTLGWEATIFNLNLWKMAHVLKMPEAEEHRRAIIAASERQQEGDMLAAIASSVAEVDVELAEKILARIPDAERIQSYQRVIPGIARRDTAAALRLLNELEKLPHEQGESYFSVAALSVIKELGKADPAGALTLARRVGNQYGQSAALVRAAHFLPKEVAIPVLKEAFTAASEYSDPQPARIAALVYDLDPQEGLKLFMPAKSTGAQWKRASNLATWAFYYSRVDPAESRILLEQEFAREKDKALQLGASHEIYYFVGAMAAVDLDRALEMFVTIPAEKEDVNSFRLRASRLGQIAGYVLTPAARRFTMSFTPTRMGYALDDE